MSNFALAKTNCRVAMKLDDDHVAMGERVAAIVANIRADGYRLPDVRCFSGINLARDESGKLGVLARDPFGGAGDHFYFEVTPATRFIHDPRFEDFTHGGKPRRFADFAYWHMKHLKPGFGFANRDIDGGGNPRFERKREAFLADRRVISARRTGAANALVAAAGAHPAATGKGAADRGPLAENGGGRPKGRGDGGGGVSRAYSDPSPMPRRLK